MCMRGKVFFPRYIETLRKSPVRKGFYGGEKPFTSTFLSHEFEIPDHFISMPLNNLF